MAAPLQRPPCPVCEDIRRIERLVADVAADATTRFRFWCPTCRVSYAVDAEGRYVGDVIPG